MKHARLLSLVVLSCTLCIAAFAQRSPKRVVIIGLDGLSATGFNAAKHPNLDTMIAAGVLSLTTRPVMPSVTLPNWTSHLTGSGPEEHGVTANSWTVLKHPLKAIDTDKDGYYPSVFKLLKEHIPNVKTAYYYNWAELINSMNRHYMDEVFFKARINMIAVIKKHLTSLLKIKKTPAWYFYTVFTPIMPAIATNGCRHNTYMP